MPEPKVRFRQDDGSSYPAWKNIPMSDVFAEISEKNHPEMPVLSVQQGVGTVMRDSSDRNILYDKANLKNYKAMKKDDFIIHLRSFEGGLECSNYDGISSPAYRILRPQAILSAAFRDYFRSYEFIHNKLAVSVVGIRDGKNIDMDTFWEIPMAIPCFEEQQKIADFLSSVDEIIAASESEVQNLETQKKAVMKKFFSQEVRFKRADGSDFPEWEETTIGEIGDVITGSTPSTKDEKNYGHDYCFCAPGDLGNCKYVVNTEKKVSEKGFVSGRAVPRGSVLATCIGSTIGKMGMAGCDMITNQQINSIVVKEDDSEYVYYAIGYCFPQYLSSVGKQAVPILSKSEFSKKSFPLPCLEEQNRIADFLSDFDEAIAAAKKELELWKELKKGLLQQMFV